MNKCAVLTLIFISFSSLCLVVIHPAEADYRAIVVPDDYPTITQAIGNATDGDTVFVKKGTYEEHTLIINKSISLIGEDADNTTLNNIDPEFRGAWPNLIWNAAIEIQTNKITISNLQIALAGGAVISIVGNGNGTTITKSVITSGRIDITGSNQTFESNKVHGTVGEFALTLKGSFNYVSSNQVTGTTGGISTSGSNNVVYRNTLTSESFIGGGLAVSGNENLVANNSLNSFASINGEFNIMCQNKIDGNVAITGNNNTFYGNIFQGIILGNRIKDSSKNLFYHNNFIFTQNPALPLGEKTFTVWEGVREPSSLDNGKEGNYWSDYTGLDQDGDGIGDTPYSIITKDPANYEYIAEFNVANLTFTDHYPLITSFDLSKTTIPLPDWTNQPTPSPTTFPPLTQSPSLTPSPSIPEFPAWIVLSLIVVTSAFLMALKGRKIK